MIKGSEHILRVTTVFIFLLLPAVVFGQYDYIDINNPFSRKIPIAIPAFAALNPNGTDPALLKKATDILTNSLDFTGFFNMLDRGAYLLEPGNPVITSDHINFRNWTTIGAELLVTCCPYCITMFEDSRVTMGVDEQIEIKDVTEILQEVI
ncbi:MAG: hypothetical protein P8Y40_12960 [Desulfobacterales bacterium]